MVVRELEPYEVEALAVLYTLVNWRSMSDLAIAKAVARHSAYVVLQ